MFFCLIHGYKIRNGNFLRLQINLVFCPFTSFMASKTKTGSFNDLINLYFLFFVVLISNKGSFYNLKWFCSYCFLYSYKIHNSALITKTARTKFLENTLNESSKVKNMSDERLECLTKSLLSQNFYRTMSDLLKTLISHPVCFA